MTSCPVRKTSSTLWLLSCSSQYYYYYYYYYCCCCYNNNYYYHTTTSTTTSTNLDQLSSEEDHLHITTAQLFVALTQGMLFCLQFLPQSPHLSVERVLSPSVGLHLWGDRVRDRVSLVGKPCDLCAQSVIVEL